MAVQGKASVCDMLLKILYVESKARICSSKYIHLPPIITDDVHCINML
jgi:hypothetical protein